MAVLKACFLLHAFAVAITSATNLIYRTLWKCYLDDGRMHWKSMEGDFISKLKLSFNSQGKNTHMLTSTCFLFINRFLSSNYEAQLSQIQLLLKIMNYKHSLPIEMQWHPSFQKENRQELLEMILIMMIISNSPVCSLQNRPVPASLHVTLCDVFSPNL